jgi:hypothetical protein
MPSRRSLVAVYLKCCILLNDMCCVVTIRECTWLSSNGACIWYRAHDYTGLAITPSGFGMTNAPRRPKVCPTIGRSSCAFGVSRSSPGRSLFIARSISPGTHLVRIIVVLFRDQLYGLPVRDRTPIAKHVYRSDNGSEDDYGTMNDEPRLP